MHINIYTHIYIYTYSLPSPASKDQEIATPDGEGQSIVLFANGDKCPSSHKLNV